MPAALTPAKNHADPGFLPDKRPRYALDTPEQVRAAQSYFSRYKGKYTSEQRAHIQKKIDAAKKKFGIGEEKASSSFTDIFAKLVSSGGNAHVRMFEPPPAQVRLDVPTSDQTFFYTAGRMLSFFPKVNANGMTFFREDCEKVVASLRGSMADIQHLKPGYGTSDPQQLKNTACGAIVDYLVHDEGIDIVVKNEREVIKAMGFDESDFTPGQGRLAFFSQECDFSPLTASWIVVSAVNPNEIVEEVDWLDGMTRGFRMSQQIDGQWKYHLEDGNPVYLRVRPSAFSGVGHVLKPADSSADIYKYAADASIKAVAFFPGMDTMEDQVPRDMINGPRPEDEALGAAGDPFGVGDDYNTGTDYSWMADDFKNHPDLLDHDSDDDLLACHAGTGEVYLNDSCFAAVYSSPDPIPEGDPSAGRSVIKNRLFRIKDDRGNLDRHRLIVAYHALCGLRGDIATASALPKAVRALALARVRKGLYQTNKLSKEISQVMTDAEREALDKKAAEIKALAESNDQALQALKAQHKTELDKAVADVRAELQAKIDALTEQNKALASKNDEYVQEKTVATRLGRLATVLPFSEDEKKAETFEVYTKSLASMSEDRFETELLRRENAKLRTDADKAVKAVASVRGTFIPSFTAPVFTPETTPELPSVLDY